MKKLMNLTAIAVTMFAFLGASTLYAQDWNKEQKEVWQEVDNMWTHWKAADMDAAFANVHDKYLGWNNESPMPMSKAKWVDPMKEKIDLYSQRDFDIEPARILVHGNVAVVHYYYEMSSIYDDGEEKHKSSYQGKKKVVFFSSIKNKS
jgi:hypothetical protein